MTDTTRESVEGHQHWRVTVETGNEQIVCIETECLSGREPSPADEQAIRTAAHHLLAFLGDDTPEYIPVLLTRAEAAEAARDALQAKLAVAVDALKGFASWNHCWPGNINLEAECRKARAALSTLTADTPKDEHKIITGMRQALEHAEANTSPTPDPRIEGWNAAIEAAARAVRATGSAFEYGAAVTTIRAIPCPYQPKEGKDQ